MERQNKMRAVLSIFEQQDGSLRQEMLSEVGATPSRPQEPMDTWPLYVSFYHLEF